MRFKRIIALSNQSLYDLAVQEYGHIDHVSKLLSDNPTLNLAEPLTTGISIKIDINFAVLYPKRLAKLKADAVKVATYTVKPEEEIIPDPPYEFTDADASVYYEALKTANGDVDIDSESLYSLELDLFKEHIDDFFAGLKSASVWDRISQLGLYIGGSSTTHAINAKTGLATFTYVGSPSHNHLGMQLTGANYLNNNNSPGTDCALNDAHLMMLFENPSNGNVGMGSSNAGSQAVRLLLNTNTSYNWSCHSNTTGNVSNATSPSMTKQVVIGTRTSPANSRFFINGVVDASISTSSGTMPSLPMFVGAMNNNGTAIYNMTGRVYAHSIGLGLSSIQSISLTNLINTLNSNLSR